jgi:hypothetical protein
MIGKRRLAALTSEQLRLLPAMEMIATEFRCGDPSVRRKITPDGPGNGGMSSKP